MSVSNRVQPSGLDDVGLNAAKLSSGTTTFDSEFSRNFLIPFKRYVESKTCYHPTVVEHAHIIGQTECYAFQIQIWTLMEKRWITWEEKPYDGEDVPGEEVGNIFDETKYKYKAPQTVIPTKETRSGVLSNTQSNIDCSSCKGQAFKKCGQCEGSGKEQNKTGQIDCSKCHSKGGEDCRKCSGRGKLLRRAMMNIEWHTVHSVMYFQNTFLPKQLIKDAGGKENFFEDDDGFKDQASMATFSNLFEKIGSESSIDFRPFIDKQYTEKHLSEVKDSQKICRLKCSIQRLTIIETDYQSCTYINKRNQRKGAHVFTYLQYASDVSGNPLIYEEDYPLNSCGCFGQSCACRSRCCSIA